MADEKAIVSDPVKDTQSDKHSIFTVTKDGKETQLRVPDEVILFIGEDNWKRAFSEFPLEKFPAFEVKE